MAEMDVSKVTVKIYGQEYTFSSPKPKDELLRIANHVDEVMRELASHGQGSMSRIAMMAAINITGELMSEQANKVDYDHEKEQLEKDVLHYQQLWEEAKHSYLQYQSDAKEVQEQKEVVQEKLNQAKIEIDSLMRGARDREDLVIKMKGELDQIHSKLRSSVEQTEGGNEQIRELKEKLKEIEGNYFELQMENIQLKGDLERFRTNL